MKSARVLLFLAIAASLTAQSPTPPSQMVDAAMMKSLGDELLKQAKLASDGIAFKILFTRLDGNEQVCVRVKSGQGEWHRDYADVLIGIEGHAQIVTGGHVVNGRKMEPGEVRGDRVDGGRVQVFNPGDAIRIEPGVAHQFLLAPGSTVRYFVVKIKAAK